MMNHYQIFWSKIRELKKEKSKYDNRLAPKEDTRKILRAVDLCLENEGEAHFYQKNSIIRIAVNFIIKYCNQRYQKYQSPTP